MKQWRLPQSAQYKIWKPPHRALVKASCAAVGSRSAFGAFMAQSAVGTNQNVLTYVADMASEVDKRQFPWTFN